MKKIAITGGKGGVGKSTFAILLANKLGGEGKKVVLCDCDVECPNDHLLLDQNLGSSTQKVYARLPELIKERCRKCGLCVQNCRSNAIFQPKGGYPIFLPELCSSCGLCWNLCPFQAIEIEKKVVGEIFLTKFQVPSSKFQTYLVTGRAVGIVEETGPIVTETRKFAQDFAQKVGADCLLIDTAPGMHCSVIRALIGVDLAYVVTEPTPLGAQDLRLIIRLLELLKVPRRVVLNQADLGKREEVEKVVKKMGVKIEYEIPYSKEIVAAYSKGKLSGVSVL